MTRSTVLAALVASLLAAPAAFGFGDSEVQNNNNALAAAGALSAAGAHAATGPIDNSSGAHAYNGGNKVYAPTVLDVYSPQYNKQLGINEQGQEQAQGQQQGQIGIVKGHQSQYGSVKGYQDTEVDTDVDQYGYQGNDQDTEINIGGDTHVQTIKHRKHSAYTASPVAASACSSGVSGQGRAGGAALAMTNRLCNFALVAETARNLGNEEVAGQAVDMMLDEIKADNNWWRRGTRHLPVIGGFLKPLF